jgi:haloacetate dehalogenase
MSFENFEARVIEADGIKIFCRVGGVGPPLLLLHGCPQTHVMWRKLVPTLARQFTVVAPDLRGYGRSDKPKGNETHENYSFRTMARDQVTVMSKLGFKQFLAMGHDRGARVLHRMCLDHPNSVEKLVLLDILPTTVLYNHVSTQFATSYWEWFFFIQPAPFPEKLLSADPEAFLRYELGALVDRGVVEASAWDEYLSAISSFDSMHGMCEDYRAGASIDLHHDAQDADKKIDVDLMLLWGKKNPIWENFHMTATWRGYASRIQGQPIDCGHYLAEEAPEKVLTFILPFLEK